MSNERQLTGQLITHKEIERRWLINTGDLADLSGFPSVYIQQVYTPMGRIRWERSVNGAELYILTIKSGNGMMKDETERLATRGEFESGIQVQSNKRIIKTRYYIPTIVSSGYYVIELDYYHDNGTTVDGNYLAEIEFSSNKQAIEFFSPPQWFSREVTNVISANGKHPYSNSQLAQHGWPVQESF